MATTADRDATPRRRSRRGLVRAVVEAGLVVLVTVAAGFGGGWWWHRWWAPGPEGVVGIPATGDQTPRWFPMPYEAGERAVFGATGQYVAVALALAAVLGVLAALLARRSPLVTLGALVVGSAAAAVAMQRYGSSLGPPDPDPIARTLQPGDTLPGALDVVGWTAYLAWPIGALLAFAVVLLVGHGIGQVRARDDDPEWLRRGGAAGSRPDADPRATRLQPPPPPSMPG